ncbi:MAG: hypothetical protein ABI718_02210 [Acidobacteriota bacterium]
MLRTAAFVRFCIVTTVLFITPCTFARRIASTEMRVSAIVVARCLLHVESAPEFLDVSSGDAARGFVDVAVPLQFTVRTNDPLGYILEFAMPRGVVRAIEIRGPDFEATIAGSDGWIVRPSVGSAPFVSRLNLRARLTPGTMPGSYPWQLAVSARPVSSAM